MSIFLQYGSLSCIGNRLGLKRTFSKDNFISIFGENWLSIVTLLLNNGLLPLYLRFSYCGNFLLTNVTMNVAEIFFETDANRRESHFVSQSTSASTELTGTRSHTSQKKYGWGHHLSLHHRVIALLNTPVALLT